jgi:ParB family transcriptional regulator, chromosome partitioning protein
MTAKKSGLGRGLGALIENPYGQEEIEAKREEVSAVNEIELSLIEVNPFQPRKDFDEEALNELTTSIKQLGIIQPLTLRKLDGNRYQLITGERRFRASQLAGLTRVPAYVREADDQAMLEYALVENIQREDLNAIEIAISYQRLVDECNLTQENLSDRVGKKRATVANYLRLLKLPAEVQLAIRDKKISFGHARAIAGISEEKEQIKVFKRVVKDELSVRATEELTRKSSEPAQIEEKVPKEVATNELPETFKDICDHLQQRFNTPVELKRNEKGVGKIIISFYSDSELEQILSHFGQKVE